MNLENGCCWSETSGPVISFYRGSHGCGDGTGVIGLRFSALLVSIRKLASQSCVSEIDRKRSCESCRAENLGVVRRGLGELLSPIMNFFKVATEDSITQ